MATTAHEDQFTAGTQTIQPVLQPYSTEAILRRNIADAEKEMQRQAERAESYAETLRSIASYVGAGGYNADTVDAGVFEEKIRWGIGELIGMLDRANAELAKLAQQEPIKYLYRVIDCFGHDVLRDDPRDATIIETIPLYAAPVPAPAVPTGCAIISRTLTPEAWKRLCNADTWPVTPKSFQRMLDVLMEVALLQSAEVTNAAADRLLEGGE